MGRRNKLGGLTRFLPQLDDHNTQRPAKKRKIGDRVEEYDATGLVPYYQSEDQVPSHLLKYFSQAERFFSKYFTPPGCLLDEEGWYSVTPERIADQIAERCRCETILDPFCGVGGNAIAFAKTCQRVIALDISPTRLALARHNAQIYGVADRIEFIQADYLSFAESYLQKFRKRKIDVVFLSPPWGGPSYLLGSPQKGEENSEYRLESILPIGGKDLFNLTRKMTENIAFYLPRNTKMEDVSELLIQHEKEEYTEVEEEWMGNKLKALTCYFGGLVEGQEALF